MKSNFFLMPLIFLMVFSCQTEPLDPAVLNPTDPVVTLEPDPGVNDPHLQGVDTGSCPTFITLPVPLNEIPTDLPQSYDLSADMPPVGSQGHYGSCVAWATGYYLKGYQEKKQYGYQYDGFDKLMSPAFVYNLAKSPGSCNVGTCLTEALALLQDKGISTWQEFPYGGSCGVQPGTDIINSAAAHKIEAFYAITPEVTPNGFKMIDVIKTMLFDEKPTVIAIKLDGEFSNAVPRQTDGSYIYKTYNSNNAYGPHAMLITGYDDSRQAFKVVNSWGTSWGNAGYCWISYDFFRSASESGFQQGLLSAYVTEDAL